MYLCFPIQVFGAGQKVPFLYVSYVLTAGNQQVSLDANCPQILVSEYAVRRFRKVILTQKLGD
jgi:hypothetical protein